MQSLAKRLKDLFSATVRARGAALRNRVDPDLRRTPHGIGVRVQGSRGKQYSVQIDPDEIEGGACGCLAFRRYGPCKHMWAAILYLDERGIAMPARESTPGNGPSAESPRRSRNRQPTEDEVATERLRLLQEVDAAPPLIREVFDEVHQVHFGLAPQTSLDGSCRIGMGLRTKDGQGRWSRRWTEIEETISLRDSGFTQEDRELIGRIRAEHIDPFPGRDPARDAATLPPETADQLLEDLAKTGRMFWVPEPSHPLSETREEVIAWSEADPVRLRLVLESTASRITIRAQLRLGEEALDPDLARACVGHHSLLIGATLHRFVSAFPLPLVRNVLHLGPISASAARRTEFEELLHGTSARPTLAPTECHFHLQSNVMDTMHGRLARGELTFVYGRETIDATETEPRLASSHHQRDLEVERQWLQRFRDAGGVLHWELQRPAASLPVVDLPKVVDAMLADDFTVFTAREPVRRVKSASVSISSGIDWFAAKFASDADDPVPIPELLAAAQQSQSGFVQLGNGSFGLLDPRELSLLKDLAWLGHVQEDEIRIPKSRGLLLDALLQARADSKVARDASMRALRRQAETRVRPKREPTGFGTTLRDYQREGLGWFQFLAKLGIGGCLADDMGLGKTVQVLALLEQQRRRRPNPGPSLVVAPRSLVFNWQREADRFAPQLRTLAFIGTKRKSVYQAQLANGFADCDLVLTTYGSLRNDVESFAAITWNYLVLDEAQAIKNGRSQTSKASRLCEAKHRLALSGTPIENHLGELWSLMEFLNPGMLGSSNAFQTLLQQDPGIRDAKALDADNDLSTPGNPGFHQTLRAAVRPFLLRRTKTEVLKDLPPKTEQTLVCELPPRQRTAYDELARHYQAHILGELQEEQLGGDQLDNKQRFQVLTALLRLRQAACHPGLLDPSRDEEPCGKFDVLLPMLQDIRSENHKALVFSQFPSLLRLLRTRLEAEGFDLAFLDGRTKKREVQVDRFQNDPDCDLFLISLKAGGTGLNLSAASYVFLLDPWWNPAAEAQAIDRAHRMGQTQNVHAYRLICQDTVEEKVAALQETKVALADLVLGDDRSVLQGLTGADVARLLQA